MRRIFYIATLVLMLFANQRYNEMIDLGDKYIRIGRYEEAEKVYEALYLEYPGDERVIGGLKTVYFALNKQEKLTDILSMQAEINPDNPVVHLDLGKLFTLTGEPKKAVKSYERAFELKPAALSFYEQAFDQLSQRSYYEEAEEIVKMARKNLEDEAALAMKMALIYEISGDYESAMEEYGKYIEKFPDRFIEIERRIDITGSSTEDLAKMEEALDKVFGESVFTKTRVYRLLSRINIRLENFSKALDNLIDAEKHDNNAKKGSYVFSFANQMISQGNLKAAEEAGEYLLSADEAFIERGHLIMANAIYMQGRIEDALPEYRELSESKIHDVRVSAILKLGEIDFLSGNQDSARVKLNMVLKSRNHGFIADALKLLVKSYSATEQLDKAKERLEPYEDQFRDEGWYLYEKAIVHLFLGEYTDAEDNFNLVIGRDPESPEANEAVEFILLLPFKDSPAFKKYLNYRKVEREGKDGISILKGLAEENSPFSDIILYELSSYYLENEQFDDALSTAQRCYTENPESFYAPLCMDIVGDVHLALEETGLAEESYTKILTDYIDYVNIADVREKLAKMKKAEE